MAQTRILPPATELAKRRRKGETNREIAEDLSRSLGRKITPQAVSQALARAGKRPAAVRYEDMLPWRVKAEHRVDEAAEMLRSEARLRRGLDVRPSRLHRLTGWKQWLAENDCVVFYESSRGFHYVTRASARSRPDAVVVDPNG